MSCICQYIASIQKNIENIEMENVGDSEKLINDEKTKSDEVSGSEPINFQIENWLLKKKLHEAEFIIANLENMVTTVVTKQQQSLCDISRLQGKYNELQTECRLQREYHAMERNALIVELRDANQLIKSSKEAIKQSVSHHELLINELERAKKKNNNLSVRFRKYKTRHDTSSDSERSSLSSSTSVSNVSTDN